MPKTNTQVETCQFCNLVHEADAYDFYKNPSAVDILLKLRGRYESLPPDEQQYRMENWAVKRGLRRNATVSVVNGQKKPEGGKVVMCGYGKLVDCDIWLRKFEDKEKEDTEAEIASELAQELAI